MCGTVRVPGIYLLKYVCEHEKIDLNIFITNFKPWIQTYVFKLLQKKNKPLVPIILLTHIQYF